MKYHIFKIKHSTFKVDNIQNSRKGDCLILTYLVFMRKQTFILSLNTLQLSIQLKSIKKYPRRKIVQI